MFDEEFLSNNFGKVEVWRIVKVMIYSAYDEDLLCISK